MNALVVYLVVHLVGHPQVPGVVLGVFATETECVRAVNARPELSNVWHLNDPRFRWACEVRT